MTAHEPVGDPIEFGARLLDTGDLDPLYIALARMPLPSFNRSWMRRFLWSYWMFYHAGAACWMADRGVCWWPDAVAEAAANETLAPTGGRWPRGAERRHFRGSAAIAASQHVVWYAQANPSWWPEETTFQAYSKRVQELPQFGPWIAWKVCDMLERLGLAPVDFSGADLAMYREPVAGARLWHNEYLGEASAVLNDREIVAWAVCNLTRAFGDRAAPPAGDRKFNVQEAETILCKWKSARGGHYWVGKDTADIREGLTQWAPFSESAHTLLGVMPEEVI